MLEVVMIFESVQFSKNQVWPITLLVALACADIMSAKTFAAAKVLLFFDMCKKKSHDDDFFRGLWVKLYIKGNKNASRDKRK